MADTDTTPTDEASDELSNPVAPETQENSLDGATTKPVKTATGTPANGTPPAAAAAATPPPAKKEKRFKRLRQINVYLLLFILIMLLAGLIIFVAFLQNRQATVTSQPKSQTLTQSTLNQLANSDATVGSSQSILNVESSAVFAGQVLIRQSLQVAGNLQIGGTLALNNLTVSGTSQFGQATVNKDLAVAGDEAIQGALTITKSLQVNGGGTFSGPLSAPQVTTSNLDLSGDLVLTHHIIAGGSTPSRSNGTALGAGGSASVSGSDTGGTININTGNSAGAGCFATITFSAKYNDTPHVLVTPVGSSAGGLSYYVNRSSSSFSICDATTPPSNASFSFDYFVVD